MELTFEYSASLGTGSNPNVVHMPDNSVLLFTVDDGRLMLQTWEPGEGDVPWDTPDFGEAVVATADQNMSLVRLKNVPRVGLFGAWHQDAVMDGETVLTPERQRFAIWGAESDVSRYVRDVTIDMTSGTPIAAVSMTLENPSQVLSGEERSLVTPGMKIESWLRFGDSEEYPMGVQYVDRVSMGVTKDTVGVEGRNITGKLLKDQTLDENCEFPYQVYHLNIVKLLEDAGVERYTVLTSDSPDAWKHGINFQPDTCALDALQRILQAALHWKMVETMDGEILCGPSTYWAPIRDLYSQYVFERGRDVWGRDIVRDDEIVYSRVCGKWETRTVVEGETVVTMNYTYANVTSAYGWITAPNKTLYMSLPVNTSTADAEATVADVAARISDAGIIETFVGPIRPQLLVGDEAVITVDGNQQLLGTITAVRHKMGKSGFSTEFTVDSGGERGKVSIKDLINSAVKPATSLGVTVYE